MSREIELTRGLMAIVDDEDYARLAEYKWCALKGKSGPYAVRRGIRADGTIGHVLMHREIFGARLGLQLDHINGNGLDNRRGNLRVATNAQNSANRRPSSKNTSGFKGVYCDRRPKQKPYFAAIKVNYRMRWLGGFQDPREAAETYDRAALMHFGKFARTNRMLGLI